MKSLVKSPRKSVKPTQQDTVAVSVPRHIARQLDSAAKFYDMTPDRLINDACRAHFAKKRLEESGEMFLEFRPTFAKVVHPNAPDGLCLGMVYETTIFGRQEALFIWANKAMLLKRDGVSYVLGLAESVEWFRTVVNDSAPGVGDDMDYGPAYNFWLSQVALALLAARPVKK